MSRPQESRAVARGPQCELNETSNGRACKLSQNVRCHLLCLHPPCSPMSYCHRGIDVGTGQATYSVHRQQESYSVGEPDKAESCTRSPDIEQRDSHNCPWPNHGEKKGPIGLSQCRSSHPIHGETKSRLTMPI